jgi:type I restriction-modification system DNA methylase subunit
MLYALNEVPQTLSQITRQGRIQVVKQIKKSTNNAALGLESRLWAAADTLRNNMNTAEYKHIVLGLILVSNIALGSAADRAKGRLGQVCEHFLSRFARAKGKSGGQFYTPSHVVRALDELHAPYKGHVYDPCCGSGGMTAQSENQ